MRRGLWAVLAAGVLVSGGFADQAVATGLYPTLLSGNTTGSADSVFLGPPDQTFIGLGGRDVTYDFGSFQVVNGPGPDFNVYESTSAGVPEFESITVLVSTDGVVFTSVNSTRGAGVALDGDGGVGTDPNTQSYDLGSFSSARFIRIDGNGIAPASSIGGFDLDAVGAINFVPEPGPLWLLGLGLGGLAVLRPRG